MQFPCKTPAELFILRVLLGVAYALEVALFFSIYSKEANVDDNAAKKITFIDACFFAATLFVGLLGGYLTYYFGINATFLFQFFCSLLSFILALKFIPQDDASKVNP